MHSSLLCSLLILSCLTVAITAQEWQTEDTEYETSQTRGASFFARFPNNTVLISVNGEARIEIPADYAEISASVETVFSNTTGALSDQASVIRDVSERTAIAMTRVIELLKSTPNVTKITTTQVELQPIYNWTSGNQVLVGYRAINSISFRVDLITAPSVLDSIVRSGISRIDSVSYSASSQHISMARTRAIQDAIKDAQMQVNAMTSNIPTTAMPEIYLIDVIAASPPEPVSMSYRRMARGIITEALTTPMPIVGGNLIILARVRVRFMVRKEMRPRPHFIY